MGLTNNLGKLSNMITSTGSAVGIGISTPTSGATLDVYNATQGNLYISSANTNDSCLRFFSGGNELVTLRSTGTGALRIETGTGSPAERIRVTATGLVGIGTTTPSGLLQLNGNIANSVDAATFTIKQSSTSFTNGIYLERGGERNGYFMYVGGALDALTFRRNYFGTQSDVMSLTRDGNVGIGTASPSYPLIVSRTLSSATSLFCLDNATNSTNDFGMDFTVLGYLRVGAIRMAYPADNNLSMAFYTYNGAGNVNERMRINNVGSLLVGQSTASIANTGWQLLAAGGGHTAFAINNNEAFIFNNINTGTTYEIDFRTNSVERGKISVTDSGVSYITTPSDINLKKNFEEWDENTLDIFKNINPKKYNFNFQEDTEDKIKGYIAQELVGYFPEAYPKSKENYFFNPSGMVVYMMKALKEAALRIEQLEAKVTALESQS